MDCNEDVRSVAITNFLNACGLRGIVLERHGSDAPRTHKPGSRPIDAIFATHSVKCVRAGYAGFEDGVQSKHSDHCCLWIDVLINSIFGHEMPRTNKPQTRRLKCNGDPRVVRSFNKYYFDFLRKNKLHERAFRLEADAIYHGTSESKQSNCTRSRYRASYTPTRSVESCEWVEFHIRSDTNNSKAPLDFGMRCFVGSKESESNKNTCNS
jgi:hypothetical protein